MFCREPYWSSQKSFGARNGLIGFVRCCCWSLLDNEAGVAELSRSGCFVARVVDSFSSLAILLYLEDTNVADPADICFRTLLSTTSISDDDDDPMRGLVQRTIPPTRRQSCKGCRDRIREAISFRERVAMDSASSPAGENAPSCCFVLDVVVVVVVDESIFVLRPSKTQVTSFPIPASNSMICA